MGPGTDVPNAWCIELLQLIELIFDYVLTFKYPLALQQARQNAFLCFWSNFAILTSVRFVNGVVCANVSDI